MVTAVVGANWGDEGKGKITDMLGEESDIIVRFQGGSNAGHTIVNDYGKFALHILPSGVFYNHTTSVILKIGGGNFAVIAGPCSIESEEQITYCAQRVKAAGASLLRGGAFKPRTSPYSFQGMRSEGLDLLKLARRATGAPIVTEIMNTEHLPLFENVDLIQVGARNMQNFELLKAVGRQKKPVLLKRGLANTLEEFVMSAEYIMAEGNENVILCERGIRTFETSMRNTLDLAGVVMLHKMTHLPVIVDPSHACGHAWMVPDLAKAAVAAGADGLMIEVHNNPAKAKCDGAQSLTPDQFDELMQFIGKEVEFFGKKLN